MKKILLAFGLSLALCAQAFAQANALQISQRTITDDGDNYVIISPPISDALLCYDVAAQKPKLCTMAAGVTLASDVVTLGVQASMITDSTSLGQALMKAVNQAAARGAIGAGTSNFSGSASDLLSGTLPLARLPALAISNTTGLQAAIDAKQGAVSLTTSGSGAATFNPTTGALNIPTPSGSSPFNFSQPSARSLSVSTSYQASDNTKAAVIIPSYSCQNATQVLASSGCTLQVRMGTGTLTCSTGTVYYTQSLTVNLGVLITQNSTNPVQINLPIGASFIICPTTGTFTISTVEQSAG